VVSRARREIRTEARGKCSNDLGAAILNFEKKSEDKGQLPEKLRSSPGKGGCLLPVRV
jgi:hypothetical protein